MTDRLRRRFAAAHGSPGFTLVEVLIAAAIFVLLTVMVTAVVINGYRTNREVTAGSEAQADIVDASSRMARDVQFATKIMSISPSTMTVQIDRVGETCRTVTWTLASGKITARTGGCSGPSSGVTQTVVDKAAPSTLFTGYDRNNNATYDVTRIARVGFDVRSYAEGRTNPLQVQTSAAVEVKDLGTTGSGATPPGGPGVCPPGGTPPGQVTGLTITWPGAPTRPTGPITVTLRWTPPSGPVTGYVIRNITANTNYTMSSPGSSFAIPNYNPPATTADWFTVVAVNDCGTGDLAAAPKVAGPLAVQGAVTGKGRYGYLNGTTIGIFTITDPAGNTADNYEIRSTTGTLLKRIPDTSTAAGEYVWRWGASASDPPTTPFATGNATLTFKVRSCQGGTCGPDSDITVCTPPAKVDNPAGRAVGTPDSPGARLTWAAPAGGADSYDVYMNGSLLANVTGTSYTWNGAQPGGFYTFYVVSRNACGTAVRSSREIVETQHTTFGSPTNEPAPSQWGANIPGYGTGDFGPYYAAGFNAYCMDLGQVGSQGSGGYIQGPSQAGFDPAYTAYADGSGTPFNRLDTSDAWNGSRLTSTEIRRVSTVLGLQGLQTSRAVVTANDWIVRANTTNPSDLAKAQTKINWAESTQSGVASAVNAAENLADTKQAPYTVTASASGALRADREFTLTLTVTSVPTGQAVANTPVYVRFESAISPERTLTTNSSGRVSIQVTPDAPDSNFRFYVMVDNMPWVNGDLAASSHPAGLKWMMPSNRSAQRMARSGLVTILSFGTHAQMGGASNTHYTTVPGWSNPSVTRGPNDV